MTDPQHPGEPAPRLSVLIVCYKAKAFIGDCLDGLFKHTKTPIEVLLVDCSGDGTVDMVRERYPSVRVIDNDENLGFARGNNFLAPHAKARDLLLLNPDTVINDDAVDRLVAFADEYPDGGAWGGVTVLPNGKIDPTCCQSQPSLLYSLFYTFGLGRFVPKGPPRDETLADEVPVLSGAYMMIPKMLWQAHDGFDESFFMFAEELDLCRRLRESGYKLWMTGESRITHLSGSGQNLRPSRILQLTQGQVHYHLKHSGKIASWVLRINLLVFATVRCVASVVLRPIVGPDKSDAWRAAFIPILLHPSAWWGGWRGETKTGA
jgi:hypothetical protein